MDGSGVDMIHNSPEASQFEPISHQTQFNIFHVGHSNIP